MNNIPITKPHFTAREKELIQKPIESGWVVQGEYVEHFEDQFADFTGARYALATTSCTTALHTAMKVSNVAEHDEVIVPAFTWVSTPNMVEEENGTPIFCDIDLETFNIDPEHLDTKVTHRTMGILPVHLFGLCAPMDRVQNAAERKNLWIVEDAACALGARIDGQHAGTFGDMGCFSFHPRKSITTGEGGMITTDGDGVEELIRMYRDHGAARSDRERHEGEEGYRLPEYSLQGHNFRMTDLQGALGCAQMDKVDEILESRRRQAKRYDQKLDDVEWLRSPITPDHHTHGYQAYVCLYRPEEPTLQNVDRLHEERNNLMKNLEENGIATRPGTHAAAHTRYYRKKYGIEPEDFPNAYIADKLTITLPMFVGLSEADQVRVVNELKNW